MNQSESPPPPAWRSGLVLVVCLALGFLLWLVTLGLTLDEAGPAGEDRVMVLGLLDLLLGLASIPLLWWVGRRGSFAAALAVVAVSGWSAFAVPAACYAVVAMASRATWPRVLILSLTWLGATVIAGVLDLGAAGAAATTGEKLWALAVATGVVAISVVIGLGLRARRATVLALRREAEAAVLAQQAMARERDAQVAAVRDAERTRIAREVHDALSHELSVIAMHAGALAYRSDLSQKQRDDTTQTIAGAARRAGAELRRVITTLRDDPSAAAPDDLSRLPHVVEQLATTGTPVDLRFDDAQDWSGLPTSTSQQVMRVARECLNNAARHAPGAPIALTVAGRPGEGVHLECRNDLTVAPSAPRSPGSRGTGMGIVGMTEVARLLGGRMEAGVVGGEYRARMWVPWPA